MAYFINGLHQCLSQSLIPSQKWTFTEPRHTSQPYRAVQLVQPLVHPHLDAQPLPDERHLVRAVLGRQELLALLLLGRRT